MLGPANGGTNWPGGSFNPENHTVYVYACNSCLSPIGPGAAAAGADRPALCGGRGGPEGRDGQCRRRRAGADRRARSRSARHAAAGQRRRRFRPLTVNGLPLIKPPYATISAINLDKGEIVWQVPHGETPDDIRNNPALKGHQYPAHRPDQLQYRHPGDQASGDRG